MKADQRRKVRLTQGVHYLREPLCLVPLQCIGKQEERSLTDGNYGITWRMVAGRIPNNETEISISRFSVPKWSVKEHESVMRMKRILFLLSVRSLNCAYCRELNTTPGQKDITWCPYTAI